MKCGRLSATVRQNGSRHSASLQAPLPPQPPPGPPPLRATGPHPPAGPPPIHAQPSYAPQPAYPPLPPGRPSAPPVQSQGAAPPNPLATVSPEVLQALSALIPQLQSQGGVQAGNPLLGLLSAALAGGGAAAAGGYGQSPGTAAPGEQKRFFCVCRIQCWCPKRRKC